MWGDTSRQTFAQRGDSIGRRFNKLQNNPKFQSLPVEERVGIKAAFYTKHIAPAYKKEGITPPDLNEWLRDSIKGTEMQEDTKLFAGSARKAAQEITLFGAKIPYEALKMAYGMKGYFDHPDAGINDMLVNSKKNQIIADRAKEKADASLAGKAVRSITDQVHSSDFWLRTHPRDGFLASASKWTGEQLIQLPIWEAMSQTKLGTSAGLSFNNRLGQTPTGRFVLRRLDDAFGGLTGNIITTGNQSTKKEDIKSAEMFAVLGAGMEGLSAALGAGMKWLRDLKPKSEAIKGEIYEGEYMPMDSAQLNTASDSAIKKWSAEHHAMGGQPMVEDIVHSGFAELVGKPVKELTATNLPLTNALVKDPALARMSTGEQMVLQSLALRHYGVPIQALPEEFQQNILQRRLELMHEAAAELPIHVPDLNYEEASKNLSSWIKSASPDVPKALEYLKSKGIDVAKVVSDNQIKTIKEQTGVLSTNAASRNASRISARPKAKPKAVVDVKTAKTLKKEYEPPEGASAKISHSDFNDIRKDTVAYLRNPVNGRRAADGTLIGKRDKRSWNERLKADNFNEFIEDLKVADGNHIQFERPEHRLLYHFANRADLPSGVRDKLLRMLKYKIPDKNAESLGKMADKLLVHLYQLAQSGRLSTEYNVFKSSNFAGAPTKWQFELNTEIDQQELEMLKKIMSQHPGGEKAMTGLVQIFQSNRRMSLATEPEQWLLYNQVLNNLVTGVIK